MKIQKREISNLKSIKFQRMDQRVVLTRQLAQFYGCLESNINKNFSRNSEKFIEEKHYFRLVGQEVIDFVSLYPAVRCNDSVTILYLWTERGAMLHAKMLKTDAAWQVFETLTDSYFKLQEYNKVEVQQKKVQELKHQIFSLENEPLTLQGFSQLSLKDRKKQRSQIWEIWRKTNAISKELNWRRIQVAKSVNLIINGMTTYRFRRLTGLSGLARDWMPLANQFCFYLAEHDLLDLLRARDWDVDFAYVEKVYPELARIAKSRVELMYEVELDSSIEEEVNRVLDFVRQQVQSNVTPYLQTEAQVLNYQHDLTYELERLESLLVEPKKVKFWSPRPLRKSA